MFKKYFMLLAFFFLGITYASDSLYNLTVKADDLRDNKGMVQFSLYNKEGTIPDKKLNLYFKMKRVPVTNKTAEVTFRNLPKGDYAVSIYHDENNNGTIDKGLILPLEGVGLTNFQSIDFFHLPNFKSASFELDKDTICHVKIMYF